MTTQQDGTRLTMTVREVAKALGAGRNQTYAAIRQGTIPSIRIGRRVLVPRAALERMLAVEPAQK